MPQLLLKMSADYNWLPYGPLLSLRIAPENENSHLSFTDIRDHSQSTQTVVWPWCFLREIILQPLWFPFSSKTNIRFDSWKQICSFHIRAIRFSAAGKDLLFYFCLLEITTLTRTWAFIVPHMKKEKRTWMKTSYLWYKIT